MSQELIIVILVIIIILIGLIGLYLGGFFQSTSPSPPTSPPPPYPVPTLATIQKDPSELHPFANLSEIIEPSLLPEAKKDYNKIILKFFEIINSQPYLIDENSGKLFGPIIQAQMIPVFTELAKKYTPSVGGKLFKYFVLKHLTVILDNYYTGPPININIPLSLVPTNNPFLQNGPMKDFIYEIIPLAFQYQSKVKAKVANASTLAPYKYFVYNIPKDIRDEVAKLYDNIVDRYIGVLNKLVAPLSEVNLETLKTLNPSLLLKEIEPMLKEDTEKIQKLLGENVPRFIIKMYNENVLPFLTNYYKGPGIYMGTPLYLAPPTGPQEINIIYPNKVFNMRPKCMSGQITKVVKGVKSCIDINVALKEYNDTNKTSISLTDSSSNYGSRSVISTPRQVYTSSPSSPSSSSSSLGRYKSY